MKPGDLLATAFAIAFSRHQTIQKAWIGISNLGNPLGSSRLTDSVQRMGELDIVLRCMEDDFQPTETPSDLSILRFSLQTTMSDWWVTGVYEIARTLKERNMMPSPTFKAMAEDLRLIRVPLDKYEIPNEKKLTAPLAFTPVPARDGDTLRYYDKTDPGRHHNIAKGVSTRGSVMWNALSIVPAPRERWIERRELSDRFLAFWPGVTAQLEA